MQQLLETNNAFLEHNEGWLKISDFDKEIKKLKNCGVINFLHLKETFPAQDNLTPYGWRKSR
jgi:hypothetical protein